MPDRLIVDPDASQAAEPRSTHYFSIAVVCAYLFFLFWLFTDALAGNPVTTPWIPARLHPLAIHVTRVAMVALPILLGLAITLQPLVYRPVPGQVIIDRSRYVTQPRYWWHLAALWPAFLFGAYFLIRSLPLITQVPAETPTVSARWLVLHSLEILLASLITFALLLNRANVRAEPKGLRPGSIHFARWQDITDATLTPLGLQLHHRAIPDKPIAHIRANQPEALAYVSQRLAEHKVPVHPGPFFHDAANQALNYALVAAVLAVGVLLHQHTSLHPATLILLLLAISIPLGLLVERRRGLHLLRPKPDPDLPASTTPHSTNPADPSLPN